jgi:hypothetical protein
MHYSYLNASTGSSFDARYAGKNPDMTPTNKEIKIEVKEDMLTPIEFTVKFTKPTRSIANEFYITTVKEFEITTLKYSEIKILKMSKHKYKVADEYMDYVNTYILKTKDEKNKEINLESLKAFEKLFDDMDALRSAAIEGNINKIKRLIENGVDINGTNSKGETALMLAAAYGQIDVINLLIDNNADVNAKSDDGKTALTIAKEQGHKEVMELLKKAGAKE